MQGTDIFELYILNAKEISFQLSKQIAVPAIIIFQSFVTFSLRITIFIVFGKFWLTLLSTRNLATSLRAIFCTMASQTSNLNCFPNTSSIGLPIILLSSINVLSASHFFVVKWNITYENSIFSFDNYLPVVYKLSDYKNTVNTFVPGTKVTVFVPAWRTFFTIFSFTSRSMVTRKFCYMFYVNLTRQEKQVIQIVSPSPRVTTSDVRVM